MRTSELAKRPVVTYAGDDVAQLKDVVYAGDGGHVSGFTLAGRGLFAGPKHEVLPWSQVAALGVDAVMVVSEAAFADASALSGDAGGEGDPGDVLGSQVLTDAGTALGTVVDVVLEVPTEPGGACDVVGYEIEASEALGTKGTKLLIPLPDTLAASGEHLVVPASARDFVAHDLAGFGASVQDFRRHLEGPA
ncbi:PRC-barrel domain-containing protein [Angustibacter aerolatus]